jgi:hypothetical protein
VILQLPTEILFQRLQGRDQTIAARGRAQQTIPSQALPKRLAGYQRFFRLFFLGVVDFFTTDLYLTKEKLQLQKKDKKKNPESCYRRSNIPFPCFRQSTEITVLD